MAKKKITTDLDFGGVSKLIKALLGSDIPTQEGETTWNPLTKRARIGTGTGVKDLLAQGDLANVDLSSKENVGIAAALVTALQNILLGGVATDGNTLAKLRALISTLATSDAAQSTQLSNIYSLLQSDDLLLDSLQEVVTYIKSNKTLIDSITTSKLNKSVYDAFLLQYSSDLALKLDKATAANDGYYAPAESNNTTGFFAGLLTAGRLTLKAALDAITAKVKILVTNGDGSKYLANNGEYKTVTAGVATGGAVTKKGTFDAFNASVTPLAGGSATPIPAPASGNAGWFWVVNVQGIYGGINYEISDWIVSDGTQYTKVDNTDTLQLVMGKVGKVVLTKQDLEAMLNLPGSVSRVLAVSPSGIIMDSFELANRTITAPAIIAILTTESNWNTDTCTAAGDEGQYYMGTDYRYDCTVSGTSTTGKYTRTPINKGLVDLYAAHSYAAFPTLAQLQTDHLSLVPGQRLLISASGTKRVYEKESANSWTYFTLTQVT